MRLVKRLLRLLTGLFPLTWGGLLLLIGSVSALWFFGLGRSDLLMWVLGGLGVIVALMAFLLVGIGALRVGLALRRELPDDPIDAECGHPAVTGFSLPTLWWLPAVGVSWEWVEPSVETTLHRRRGWWQERVVPSRRGEADRVVRDIVVSDAFGIARVRFQHTQERRFRALPNKGGLGQLHVVQGLAGGDAMAHPEGQPLGDRFDMRHYNPGDPIRFVLWKVFAKSRELVIRTPEQAISPIQQTIAYLVTGPGDEAAAGAARVVVDHAALGGDWALGADGLAGEARSRSDALNAIVRSSRTAEEQAGAGLSRFLADAPGGTRRAVVFVPPTPGPWLDKVVDAARAQIADTARLDFVVCIDGLAPPRRRGLAGRLLLADRPAVGTGADREDLIAVVTALASTRGKVMVVDRVAGQVLPSSHLKALERAA